MQNYSSPFRFRHGLLFAIIMLVGVPWYWAADRVEPYVSGLPIWAFVSLMLSVVLALYTAWIIMCHWDDDA